LSSTAWWRSQSESRWNILGNNGYDWSSGKVIVKLWQFRGGQSGMKSQSCLK
jgi:hypothetical protein